MQIAGHRGASGTEPENTIASFKAALAMGADGVELDVKRCKSGEMVVIHDDTIDRTSNGTGRVKDLTLAELKLLDFGNGEQIHTLSETLEALKGGCKNGQNPTVFVEMKGAGSKQVAGDIRDAVKNHGYSYDQLPVIGFNPKQIGLTKVMNPKIQIALSMANDRPAHEKKMLIPMAKAMGAFAINPEHTMITPEFVDKAHAAGLKVNTWTVNEHADIKRVTQAGVDCIMSDHPDRAKLISRVTAKSAPQQQMAL